MARHTAGKQPTLRSRPLHSIGPIMPIVIKSLSSLTEEEGAALAAPLLAFNRAAFPAMDAQTVALILESNGERIEGGLWGEILYDWLRIDIVAVPENLRGAGIGTRLMVEAEAAARHAGCEGLWLDTFSFQARGFYEKLGFEIAGEIPNHPRGESRYFMRKQLHL